MGAHRKPKTKPTAFAAIVTAAIVVPSGTAAAATYGAFGSTAKSGASGPAAAGLLAAKANTAATSAASSTIRHITVAPTPTATTSAIAAAATKPSPRPTPSNPTAASASPSPAASTPQSQSTKPPASSPSPAPSKSAPASTTGQSGAYKNVALSSLEPTGLYGAQQYFTLTSDQWTNAKTIVTVTKQRGMPLYAAVIATATAMQESSLTNLTYSSNYDSLGLFQQRPSMGWGTAAQVTDPTYATNAFLTALVTYAPNYASQALWESAQAVQRSGLPTAYAQWEDQAAMVVQAIANGTA